MSDYVWGLVAGGLLVAGGGLAFGLILIMVAARERRAAQGRVAPGASIAEAGIEREARRLAAELDDPAKVGAWLAGGLR